jgi:putative redox protein
MRAVARRRPSGEEGTLGFAHEVEIEGGHTLLVDEPLEAGGTDCGPAPTRLLAASLAACTAITVEMYAERKGWDVGAVEVEVEVAHDGHMPTAFEVSLRLPAHLSDAEKERLVGVAAKCPVHKVLRGETPVSVADRVEEL